MYIYINMRQTLKGLCFGPSVITLVLPLLSVCFKAWSVDVSVENIMAARCCKQFPLQEDGVKNQRLVAVSICSSS